jgi:hypothetical protein
VGDLNQEKANLEASIQEIEKYVRQDIVKIIPTAEDAISKLMVELRRGHDEIQLEIQQIKNEALEVGERLGRYKEIVETNEWLNELSDLVRGEESLEGKRVRTIILPVLQGTTIWLKHHKGNNPVFSPMIFTAEKLIRELEQWPI